MPPQESISLKPSAQITEAETNQVLSKFKSTSHKAWRCIARASASHVKITAIISASTHALCRRSIRTCGGHRRRNALSSSSDGVCSFAIRTSGRTFRMTMSSHMNATWLRYVRLSPALTFCLARCPFRTENVPLATALEQAYGCFAHVHLYHPTSSWYTAATIIEPLPHRISLVHVLLLSYLPLWDLGGEICAVRSRLLFNRDVSRTLLGLRKMLFDSRARTTRCWALCVAAAPARLHDRKHGQPWSARDQHIRARNARGSTAASATRGRCPRRAPARRRGAKLDQPVVENYTAKSIKARWIPGKISCLDSGREFLSEKRARFPAQNLGEISCLDSGREIASRFRRRI